MYRVPREGFYDRAMRRPQPNRPRHPQALFAARRMPLRRMSFALGMLALNATAQAALPGPVASALQTANVPQDAVSML